VPARHVRLHQHRGDPVPSPALEVVLPAAGIGVAGYVLYHNLWPVPASPFDVFPYIVAAGLAIGVTASRFI
jgi:hypothetical protein